jgi:hypothetical protein
MVGELLLPIQRWRKWRREEMDRGGGGTRGTVDLGRRRREVAAVAAEQRRRTGGF